MVAMETHSGLDLVPHRLVGPAATWESLTPFVPQLHYKASRDPDRDRFVAVCAERDLAVRGLPPAAVDRMRRPVAWSAYRRHRRKDRLADAARGYGLRITFAEPVSGPILIGAMPISGWDLQGRRFERRRLGRRPGGPTTSTPPRVGGTTGPCRGWTSWSGNPADRAGLLRGGR
ncbi:MAG: hypothetical protein ACRD1K_10180 [Acidimicrobiales bacterium]